MKKEKRIVIRVTNDEHLSFLEASKRSMLTLSTWARRVLVNGASSLDSAKPSESESTITKEAFIEAAKELSSKPVPKTEFRAAEEYKGTSDLVTSEVAQAPLETSLDALKHIEKEGSRSIDKVYKVEEKPKDKTETDAFKLQSIIEANPTAITKKEFLDAANELSKQPVPKSGLLPIEESVFLHDTEEEEYPYPLEYEVSAKRSKTPAVEFHNKYKVVGSTLFFNQHGVNYTAEIGEEIRVALFKVGDAWKCAAPADGGWNAKGYLKVTDKK